jgi:hypothetical protein
MKIFQWLTLVILVGLLVCYFSDQKHEPSATETLETAITSKPQEIFPPTGFSQEPPAPEKTPPQEYLPWPNQKTQR